MFQKIMLTLLISILTILQSFGQDNNLMMVNSRAIDAERYSDIKGEPYLYKEWMRGKTINSKSEVIEDILLNYNGYTHNMEVKKGNSFIELDAFHYPLVIMYDDNGKEIYFKRSSSRSLINQYPRLIYSGDDISFVREFHCKVETITINDVGAIREVNEFKKRRNYYFEIYGQAKYIKLRKKSILKVLGNQKELEKYIKSENLKLNSEADVIKLLEYFEAQGMQIED